MLGVSVRQSEGYDNLNTPQLSRSTRRIGQSLSFGQCLPQLRSDMLVKTNSMRRCARNRGILPIASTFSTSLSLAASGDSASLSSDLTEPSSKATAMDRFRQASALICNLFPVWTLVTAGSALYRPALFEHIDPKSFTGLIGALMLCMGITLKPSDFKRVLQRPVAVALAFVGCYVVMPALAIILSQLFNLGPSLSAGLVLVSCINGAQASNLCTYIGQGDLALSVMMTTMTTMGAIVMTPTVGKLLLGKVVPVDSLAIAKSTVQVVLAPIILGMVRLILRYFPHVSSTYFVSHVSFSSPSMSNSQTLSMLSNHFRLLSELPSLAYLLESQLQEQRPKF